MGDRGLNRISAKRRVAINIVIILVATNLLTLAADGDHWPIKSAVQGRIRVPGKDEITIVVTDSGLGGLSIAAEIAARMKTAKSAKKVHLVFFSALFSNESGYNSLRRREDKIRVFNSALLSMDRNVRPDIIVIGCNTLSVIYADTPFAKTARIPVVGIIEAGVEMLRRALDQHPDAAIVLFGTETTISDGTHRKALAAGGIAEKRIITKACPELAAYLENDWRSEEARFLIASYVDEALAALADPKPPVFAGLVCTHYGYALDLWKTAFQENGSRLLGILNPNTALVDALFDSKTAARFKNTDIEAQIISMVDIDAPKRNSLSAWLGRVSPEVAAALANYQLRPDLFEWKSLVKE